MTALEDAMAGVINQVQRTEGMPAFEDPQKEYRFHPVRKWRFDFAWPERMIALEVEGGIWVRGAHNRGKHFNEDCEKYNEAALLGWKVFRFTTNLIEDGSAYNMLERIFST